MQYRRVSIPSVGTIQLIHQSPQLNVVDKVILPPSFSTAITADDTVPEHQLNFLAAALKEERDNVLQALQQLGKRLKSRIEGEGFDWTGIGLIRQNNITTTLALLALELVPAERVLRQGAEHNVLVGDQQRTSTQMAARNEEGEEVKKERSVFVIIGWILLVLSILFIVFILYQGKFRLGSTGSRSAPTGYWQAQEELQHKHFRLQ